MSKETIYETYKRELCSNCRNKNTNVNLCHITKNIKGNLQCCYYERENKSKGYKKFKNTTATQLKPVMKNIIK